MANKVRTHILSDAPTDKKLTPKHLTRQEFAKRVYQLMLGKGWNQSELSRRSGLPRDSISVYMRAKSLPTPVNLQRLASALGVAPEELLPNRLESAIDEDNPSFEIRSPQGMPSKAWVRVNRLVSMSTATKIAELLEADNAAD